MRRRGVAVVDKESADCARAGGEVFVSTPSGLSNQLARPFKTPKLGTYEIDIPLMQLQLQISCSMR